MRFKLSTSVYHSQLWMLEKSIDEKPTNQKGFFASQFSSPPYEDGMRRIAWLARIANYTSGTRWYRRFWNIEVTFQLEFPCKTQRRNGPRVVRIRNEANSYFHQECYLDYAEYKGTVRREREKRRRRGYKKGAMENSERTFAAKLSHRQLLF